MEIPFWKMHGAGNDFVLVDDRQGTFPAADAQWIAAVAARRTGVGCEGVILIQPSQSADFRMRFFNPDGSEVDMCGNGARCVARLAYEMGIAGSEMTIETAAGALRAQVRGERVKLWMTAPRDWRMHRKLSLNGREFVYHHVNTGVPHVVVEVENLDEVDVAGLGRGIRNHADFYPGGTNVNFIHITGANALRIRTYERGVEAETLACGTGIVAAGLIAGRLGRAKPPVAVTCASGDVLTVDYRSEAEVTLEGPAEHVFRGVLTYPPHRR